MLTILNLWSCRFPPEDFRAQIAVLAYTFRVPWYPKAIVGVLVALTVLTLVVRPFRVWLASVDLRWLIGFHFIRFVGFYFLYLYALDELPYRFAVWGGVGDIAVATLAIAAIYFVASKPAVIIWNLLGLADILAVVVTAARSELAVPGSMHQLDHFPLILLPTAVVPLVIFTHAVMVIRLVGTKR